MSDLSPSADPLTTAELRRRVEELAARPERWAPRVHHDPDRRVFECLAEEPDMEVWLICWMPGHDTGFHDHDLSSGAVTVLTGEVCEHRLHVGRGVTSETFAAGSTFSFTPEDIHRVTHAGDEPAVTLHAYSPRLRRMGAYSVARDGLLRRHPLAYGEELRPLEPA